MNLIATREYSKSLIKHKAGEIIPYKQEDWKFLVITLDKQIKPLFQAKRAVLINDPVLPKKVYL